MDVENIFENIPSKLSEELISSLLLKKGVKIERIVSKGHKSKDDFWYDQESDEWVLLVKGEAVLEFEKSDSVRLKEGDHLLIPSRCKHRVKWTDPDRESIWVAVFIE